ncbi:MAG: PPC domain-containing protein [Nitrospinae bacterium]|nr:PPC domain-containing protein [Nitrospinota bacterium]
MKKYFWGLATAALFAISCGSGGDSSSTTAAQSAAATGNCTGSATVAAGSTVGGTAYYEDRTYNSTGFTGTACKPIRYAKVEVIKGGSVIASTTTNFEGMYSVAPGATGTMYVRVIAEAASPYSEVVKDNRDSSTYAVSSASFTLASGQGATVVLGAAKEDVGQAFNVFDNIIKTQDALKTLSSASPPLITAYWYSGKTEGTWYYKSGGAHFIDLLGKSTDSDSYDDSVILHEMGHYAASAYSKDDSPGGSHSLTGHYDLRLSWSEGWATFFSSLVKSISVESNPAVYVDTNGASGTGASTLLFTFEIDTPSSSALAIGADNEMAVGNVLWHIYASPADGTHLGLGSTPIWNIFSQGLKNTTSTVTFETFYDLWVAGGLSSLTNILKDRLIKYSADLYESDDTSATARTVTAGTTESAHSFFPASDKDWYKISVTSGTAYTFSTLTLGDGADTLLTLYDSNGTTQLAQNDDDSSLSCSNGSIQCRASKIAWTANATKTVYLLAEPYRPLVSGTDISYSSSTTYPAAVTRYGSYTISVQ